jgi:ArsR family transcriptional regulator
MRGQYKEYAQFFKALSDTNRLMIVDMLSCGELCACVILDKFDITQPTLSHHMKTLCDCGLVNRRKEGKWTYYSIDEEKAQRLKSFLEEVTTTKDDCICHRPSIREDCCNE